MSLGGQSFSMIENPDSSFHQNCHPIWQPLALLAQKVSPRPPVTWALQACYFWHFVSAVTLEQGASISCKAIAITFIQHYDCLAGPATLPSSLSGSAPEQEAPAPCIPGDCHFRCHTHPCFQTVLQSAVCSVWKWPYDLRVAETKGSYINCSSVKNMHFTCVRVHTNVHKDSYIIYLYIGIPYIYSYMHMWHTDIIKVCELNTYIHKFIIWHSFIRTSVMNI